MLIYKSLAMQVNPFATGTYVADRQVNYIYLLRDISSMYLYSFR